MPSMDIYPATALNSPKELQEVLNSAFCDPSTNEVPFDAIDEINEILSLVPKTKAELAERYCAIAKASGSMSVIGMMTLKQPDKVMRSFAQSKNPVELTDAYTLKRKTGVGSTLVYHMEQTARERGHTEIVLVSGPRFRWSGWPFWTKLYGESVGVAERYFENTYDGQVWRKSLTVAK
jgi:hypothetical protein